MSNLFISIYVLGEGATNCYFIGNTQTNETIIIDPADNARSIQSKCEEMNLKPITILLTHGHYDHILAVNEVREIFKIPVYAGLEEKELLADFSLNCSELFGGKAEVVADKWLNDGDILELAGMTIKVIRTPGHTAGSICYYFESENLLVSGDTLFKGTFGRTDLPTGNMSALIQSITQKLFTLPDNTDVYPGHGRKTIIANEKWDNWWD